MHLKPKTSDAQSRLSVGVFNTKRGKCKYCATILNRYFEVTNNCYFAYALLTHTARRRAICGVKETHGPRVSTRRKYALLCVPMCSTDKDVQTARFYQSARIRHAALQLHEYSSFPFGLRDLFGFADFSALSFAFSASTSF